MRIQDLELQSGLDRATIRYYEKQEMISPVRHENGYRDYSEADLKQLLKIKLLRQLGMPIYKIKALQQGSEDFQRALKEQISLLEAKRDTAQRSAQVCMQMQTDGVTYATLNASYYLEQFRTVKPQYPQSAPVPKLSDTFREHIAMEYHPFRRFFARLVDIELLAMLILFVQVVFFRARSDAFSMPHILLLLVWIPLETICYMLFATTPGKLAFGMRVHDIDGRKLSFTAAAERAFGAYRYGMGWGIPIWQLWRQYKSYKKHNDGEVLEWEQDSEITYDSFITWKDKSKPIVVFSVLIAIIITTFSLMAAPKYGNSDLNIEQFSANYNEYNKRLKANCGSLNPDGTFKTYTGNGVIISIGSDAEFDDFEYTLENGVVKGINYEETHNKVSYVSIIPKKCALASLALLSAQEGETLNSLDTFMEEMKEKINSAAKNGFNKVTFDHGNMRIHWSIEYKNCNFGVGSGGGWILVNRTEGIDGTAKIQFRIELIDQETQ
jgi:DNA-binding transcriptional MerR regulator/uncharacterized RDD family membrane protein YckC